MRNHVQFSGTPTNGQTALAQLAQRIPNLQQDDVTEEVDQ